MSTLSNEIRSSVFGWKRHRDGGSGAGGGWPARNGPAPQRSEDGGKNPPRTGPATRTGPDPPEGRPQPLSACFSSPSTGTGPGSTPASAAIHKDT